MVEIKLTDEKYYKQIAEVWNDSMTEIDGILKESEKKGTEDEIYVAWKKAEKDILGKKDKPIIKVSDIKKFFDHDAFVQDTLYKNGLLFLGIGASFQKGCEKSVDRKLSADYKYSVQYETDHLNKGGRGTDDYYNRKKDENAGKDKEVAYQYYRPMNYIADETGYDRNWSNIDVTLFRTKNQKVVEFFFRQKKFINVMENQLRLAKKLITIAEPEMIIASNALVREVLNYHPTIKIKETKEGKKIEVNSGLKFDNDNETMRKYGTPLICLPDKQQKIPIFFTSMLSGQRALDNGSIERLVWHIKNIKDKLGK